MLTSIIGGAILNFVVEATLRQYNSLKEVKKDFKKAVDNCR